MQSIRFEELYRAYHDFGAFRPPIAYKITIKKNSIVCYKCTLGQFLEMLVIKQNFIYNIREMITTKNF
jgi:hypothetical protein